jgi:hypothetical protein
VSEKQPVRLKLPAVAGHSGAVIEVGGEDIAHRVRDITVTAGVDELTRIEINYMCQEGVDVDGEAYVHHVCPLKGTVYV